MGGGADGGAGGGADGGAGGWAGLARELRLDAERLWRRNLGRDDRVVSSLGREARQPFLDEGVAALVRALPLPFVADPRLPHGVGDKMLLRAAARLLGLRAASVRVKRAMHFGTRIALHANNAAFGSGSAARASGDADFELGEGEIDSEDDAECA